VYGVGVMVSVWPVYFPMKKFMYQLQSRGRHKVGWVDLPSQSLFSQPKKTLSIVSIADYQTIEVPVMNCLENNPFFGATQLPMRATEKALTSHAAMK
jgi:hypothetical protein